MKRKYKNITVPYHYFNKKTNNIEYIYNDKNYTNLNELFNDFIGLYLTYHININNKEIIVHSFDEVIELLVYNYKVFKINKEYEIEYSNEELKYIKKLQKHLKEKTLQKPQKYERDYKITLKNLDHYRDIKIAKKIYNKYQNTNFPKKIFIKEYNNYFYVLKGEIYYNITSAINELFFGELYFQYGGPNKENQTNHFHEHTFEDLILSILIHPDDLIIHSFQKDYYSEQELKFLKTLKNKFKEMNFHSIEYKIDYIDYNEFTLKNKDVNKLTLFINNIKEDIAFKKYQKSILESHKIKK